MDKKTKYDIYAQVLDYLSDGRTVIYLAESHPSHVMRQITRAMNRKQQLKTRLISNKDLHDYVTSGALTVIDRDELYSSLEEARQELDVNRLIHSLHSLISEARRKRSGSSTNRPTGIVAISTGTAFLQRKGIPKLLEYEKQLQHDNKFGRSVEFVCWYNDLKLFERLPLTSLLSILNAHDATIHTCWKYRKWYSDSIFGHVRDGIDNVLGAGSAYLIFKTLSMVYNVNPQEAITSKPELFEEKVMKILGERTAENVFGMIADGIRKDMAYGQIADVR
jgi:hypothetical protein